MIGCLALLFLGYSAIAWFVLGSLAWALAGVGVLFVLGFVASRLGPGSRSRPRL